MTKTELIALVSEKSELTKKDADKAVTAVIEAIKTAPAAISLAALAMEL